MDNPEFNGSSRPFPQNLFAYVTDWLGASSTKSEAEIQQGALKRFSDRLDVTRVGLTYVIEVSFRALSPNLAAAIANDITNTYVAEQLETKPIAPVAPLNGCRIAFVGLTNRRRMPKERSSNLKCADRN